MVRGAVVDVVEHIQPRADRAHGSAGRDGGAHKRQRLHHDDDDADAGHDPGDHRVRGVGHEATHAHDAQQHLDETRHDDDGERLGEVVRMGGDHDRHRHGHGTGGAGYLRPRSPEHRCKETHRNRAVEAGNRAETRRDAEGQRYRQPHHRRGDTPKEVATQGLQVVAHHGVSAGAGRQRDTDPKSAIPQDPILERCGRNECVRKDAATMGNAPPIPP